MKAVKGRLDRLLKNFNYFLPRTDDCLKEEEEEQGEKLKRGETDSKRRGKRGMKEYRRGNEEKKI